MRSIEVVILLIVVALTVAEFWLYFICQSQAELKGEKSTPSLMRSSIITCFSIGLTTLVKVLSPEYGQFYVAFFLLGRGILCLFCWGVICWLSSVWDAIRDSFTWQRWRLICKMFSLVESVAGAGLFGVAYALKMTNNLAFAGSWAPWVAFLGFFAIMLGIVICFRLYQWLRQRSAQKILSGREDPPLLQGEEVPIQSGEGL